MNISCGIIQLLIYENEQKGAFIWLQYDDIDEECKFIGNTGYITVKVFLESDLILTFDKVENGELNP